MVHFLKLSAWIVAEMDSWKKWSQMIRTNVALNAVRGILGSPVASVKTAFVKMYNDLCQIKVISSNLLGVIAFATCLNK